MSTLNDYADEKEYTNLEISYEEDSVDLIDQLNPSNDQIKDAAKKIEPELIACVVCKGSGLSKHKRPCKECDATGKMNKHLLDYFATQFEKALKHASYAKAASGMSTNSVYADTKPICSECKKSINTGEPVFICSICSVLKLCKDCEANAVHPYPMFKYRVKGERDDLKVQIVTSGDKEIGVDLGHKAIEMWTIKNVGDRTWPSDTKLVHAEGDKLNGVNIGALKAEHNFDVIMKINPPAKLGCYIYKYQLMANEKVVGGDFVLKIRVKNSSTKNSELYNKIKKLTEAKELPKEHEDEFILLAKQCSQDLGILLDKYKKLGYDFKKTLNNLNK